MKNTCPFIFSFLLFFTCCVISVGAIPSCMNVVRAAALTQGSVSSPEDAEDYIRELLTGDAASLEESFSYTDEMKKGFSALGGMEGLRKSLDVLGDLKQIESASVKKTGTLTSYSVPCVFKLMKIDLILSVDNSGRIAGLVTGPYSGGGDTLKKEDAGAVHFREEALSVPVSAFENGELPGTLLLPEGEGPFPALVLIHGSGPNDRDETLMDNTPFKDIAEGLAERGIAVYRFDKRTYVYGAEMAADTQITLYDETVCDAAKALQTVAAQDSIDSSRIFMLGHSLGGMALPAIDRELENEEFKACGYIFLAAPARSLATIMKEQYDFLYSLTPALTKEQEQKKEELYQELDALKDLDACESDVPIAGACPAYWKYLETYDIRKTAEAISVPCLVLQGEEDYQVTMEDFALWQEAFGEQDNWQFHSYPGLIHIFVPGQKKDGSAAYLKAQKVDETVISDIASFILGNS